MLMTYIDISSFIICTQTKKIVRKIGIEFARLPYVFKRVILYKITHLKNNCNRRENN